MGRIPHVRRICGRVIVYRYPGGSGTRYHERLVMHAACGLVTTYLYRRVSERLVIIDQVTLEIGFGRLLTRYKRKPIMAYIGPPRLLPAAAGCMGIEDVLLCVRLLPAFLHSGVVRPEDCRVVGYWALCRVRQ